MLIATDPLSLVFIACFLFGLLFLLVTSLLGNLGHGHSGIHSASHHGGGLHLGGHAPASPALHAPSHAGPTHTTAQGARAPAHSPAGSQQSSNQGSWLSYLSFINPTAVVFFLVGFGFLGYVFHNTANLVLPLTLVFAALGGGVLALLILLLLSRIFGDTDVSTELDVSDRTGLLGKVSITIPENGLGEIIYISPGGMHKSIPARSTDGRRLERDQEVVVVNYQRGVAEIDTWERFINEEDGLDPNASASNEDELAKLRALLEESDLRNSKLALQNDLQKE
jgi:hypothetical protein